MLAMKAGRIVLGALLSVLVVGIVAVSVALVHSYRLRGEWVAVVVIADGVVLGHAGLMVLLGFELGRRMRDGRPAAAVLVWSAAWTVLGPLPVSLYSVFHCIKVFG